MNGANYDVVVIGGGPAGLSATLVLGRSCRDVMLIDAERPRNAVTRKTHGFITRDGTKPEEFRSIAKQQLMEYETINSIKDVVESIERIGNHFLVTTHTGNFFHSRRVIIATGMQEELPNIQGLREVYGKSVSHCPYCDGWERRNEPLAVFGSGEKIVHYTKLIYNWSKDIIVFTNGSKQLDQAQKRELDNHNIMVVEEPIKELQSNNGKLDRVIVENGESFERTSGFIMKTGEKQAFTIPDNLFVKVDKHGGYQAEHHGQTSVEGLYVVGDAKNSFTGLAGAAGEGYEAGVTINAELVEEDWHSI